MRPYVTVQRDRFESTLNQVRRTLHVFKSCQMKKKVGRRISSIADTVKLHNRPAIITLKRNYRIKYPVVLKKILTSILFFGQASRGIWLHTAILCRRKASQNILESFLKSYAKLAHLFNLLTYMRVFLFTTNTFSHSNEWKEQYEWGLTWKLLN